MLLNFELSCDIYFIVKILGACFYTRYNVLGLWVGMWHKQYIYLMIRKVTVAKIILEIIVTPSVLKNTFLLNGIMDGKLK
jgi:hypothetical protein